MKPEQPKRQPITVNVRQGTETVDFDAWVRAYVRAVIASELADDAAVATPSRASVG